MITFETPHQYPLHEIGVVKFPYADVHATVQSQVSGCWLLRQLSAGHAQHLLPSGRISPLVRPADNSPGGTHAALGYCQRTRASSTHAVVAADFTTGW